MVKALIIGIAAFGCASAADAAVTFKYLTNLANVFITSDGTFVTDGKGRDFTSRPALPSTVSGFVARDDEAVVSARSSGTVTFEDPGHFTYAFGPTLVTGSVSSVAQSAYTVVAQVAATYEFTVDTATVIKLDYSIPGSRGAAPVALNYKLFSVGQGFSDAFALTGAGQRLSGPFGPGSYLLSLTARPSITVSPGESGFASTSGVVDLDFLQSGVPEPATWTMLIVGFGAVGWALRRRPRVAPSMIEGPGRASGGQIA